VQDDDLIQIATFSYRHEAEFALSVLEAAGIDAMVRDGFFAGLRPHVLFASGGVPLFVRAEDAEEAKAVLASSAIPADEKGTPDPEV
jgi:hypothetical protein